MASSIGGTGTVFYGQRDFRSDGSFVTTEWVTFIWIPLFPLSSMRLKYLAEVEGPVIRGSLGWSCSYAVVEKTRPLWKQVASVYVFAAFVAVSGSLLSWLIITHAPTGIDAFVVLALILFSYIWPFIVLFLVRRKARRRAIEIAAMERVVSDHRGRPMNHEERDKMISVFEKAKGTQADKMRTAVMEFIGRGADG